MAQKTLDQRPTSATDYAWTDPVRLSRDDFVDAYLEGEDSVIATICLEAVSYIPYVSYILSANNVMCSLTGKQKSTMVNDISKKLIRDTSVDGCEITFKFKGYQKGSQGWFWLPSDAYKVAYY